MRFSHKILLNFVIIAAIIILFYAYHLNEIKPKGTGITKHSSSVKHLIDNDVSIKLHDKQQVKSTMGKIGASKTTRNQNEYNVWCIFTKVTNNSPLKRKFERFAVSLIQLSSVFIKLHLIIDDLSKVHAQEVLKNVKNLTNKTFDEYFYEVNYLADNLEDIISAMQPHFSSQPGSYYSDALFFLSLGLHRIAKNQSRAIMFDADVKLLADVALLFEEFQKFQPTTLFGLAPELSPVYHHILYTFKSKYKHTVFGDPIDKGGFPGVNSGVIMFQFDNIRNSQKYNKLLKPETVQNLTAKYVFKGHLGDQDFYTLLAMEYPSMIYILGCEWNRQLCKWWKNHGYEDIFDDFFRCEKQVKIYHGNCNSAIPSSSLFPI